MNIKSLTDIENLLLEIYNINSGIEIVYGEDRKKYFNEKDLKSFDDNSLSQKEIFLAAYIQAIKGYGFENIANFMSESVFVNRDLGTFLIVYLYDSNETAYDLKWFSRCLGFEDIFDIMLSDEGFLNYWLDEYSMGNIHYSKHLERYFHIIK